MQWDFFLQHLTAYHSQTETSNTKQQTGIKCKHILNWNFIKKSWGTKTFPPLLIEPDRYIGGTILSDDIRHLQTIGIGIYKVSYLKFVFLYIYLSETALSLF